MLLSPLIVASDENSAEEWGWDRFHGVDLDVDADGSADKINNSEGSRLAALDEYFARSREEWNVPGMAIAIVKDDIVVFSKGYGVRDSQNSLPVTNQTRFAIASNTKAFTATALSVLNDAGVLNLNDKVQKWMPEFKLKDELAGKELNIVDLLSHRIGFESFQGDFTYWSSNLTRAEVIQKMSLINAPYSFRTRWGYCNAAYVTAGELIPRVIGENWEDTVKDSILVPLKMDRTIMLSEDLDKASNYAKPHSIIDDELTEIPIARMNNLAAAGSMSSSVKDMTRWLIAQLNNGNVNGEQVLSPRSILRIRSSSSMLGIDTRNYQKTHFYLYGMGLMINDRDGKLVYSHTGGVDCFVSSVLFVPEEKLGIVVLTNTDQNNFYQDLTDEIRDSFLGMPYQDYSKNSLEAFKQNKLAQAQKIDSLKKVVQLKNETSLSLNKFTGDYSNDVYGRITLKLKNEVLNISFSNHPNLRAKLEHLQDDNFLCTFSIPIFGTTEMPFKVENGKVSGLTLKVADFIEFTPYQFRKID